MALLITNIKQLVQVEDTAKKWVAGAQMNVLPSIENAYLYIKDERIEDFGPMQNCPNIDAQIIDAQGKMVFPCWADSHTHIVFAGSRETEFEDRINGLTYEQIAERGGGILNSAKRLQQTTEADLYEQAMVRVKEVVGMGTGAIEIKSGYGLTPEAEMKMLRVAKQIEKNTNLLVKTTFLGAHAFPMEYRQNKQAYIDLVCDTMMPMVAKEGLADYCDAFCEKGFFEAEQVDYIMKKGAEHGMRAKVHANQLSFSGGVQVGVANNAISVDHLECMGEAEINALKNSDTMATLLPSASFFLDVHYPPARMLIDAGLPVALATDFNPGSSPSGNIPLLLGMSCVKMKMTPNEAINAATINSSYAMEIEKEFGSICKGKFASVFITKPIPSTAFMPYMFGSNLVETVILKGVVQ